MPVNCVLLTTTEAVAGRTFPTPCEVVKPPTGIVFLNVPAAVPAGAVTSTEMLQVPGFAVLPGVIVPPVKLIVVEVVETFPLQVFPTTLTTLNGAGKLSETFTPV